MNNAADTLPANWTAEQRAAYAKLMERVTAAPVISFGKAPKGGWKESDRVGK